MWRHQIRILFLVLVASCGQQPFDADHPGECSRPASCSSAFIASSTMRVRFLVGQPSDVGQVTEEVSCAGETSYQGLVPVRFVIERPKVLMPGETNFDSIGAEAPSAEGSAPKDWEPVPNVSFVGLINAGVVTQSLATPDEKKLWCTDACGVGTIFVKPKCTVQTINVGVYSGPAAGSLLLSIQ